MRCYKLILLFGVAISSCSKKDNPGPILPVITDSVVKPLGVFSSAGSTSNIVMTNPELRGVLIRAFWKDIETTEGSFNFSAIDNQVASVKAKNKKYSLAILAGGIGSPDWLINVRGAPYYNYNFRGLPYKLPLIWNDTVLTYLGKLADKLAERYKNDTSLQLVYITQMTANGIEGHLNGFNLASFTSAGYSETKWINASLQNAKKFATAFDNKALAFEVHDLFNSSIPASTIIYNLWNDGTLHKRVGAAMWWISGNNTYQPNLINVLQSFPGDIYCQVIDRSDSTNSFPGGDYTKVFQQAKQLRVRYIEPWDHEFYNSSWNSMFNDFNQYADTMRKY